jgi:hypothetical protein
VGYFCNFQKLTKVNKRPLGKNSHNLVILMPAEAQNNRSALNGAMYVKMSTSKMPTVKISTSFFRHQNVVSTDYLA